MDTQVISPLSLELQEVQLEVPKETFGVQPEAPKETSAANQKTGNNPETMKPGTRLRHAREQKNISVQHVADKLYLDVNVIKALEAGDYSSLPSTIFVRGYLRNYARLLEIPPDTVLESYELAGKQLSPLAITTTTQENQKTQASSNSWWVKAVSFILLIGLIVLIALWGFNTNSPLPTPEELKPSVNLELKKPQPIPPPSSNSTSGATQPLTPSGVTGTGAIQPAENKTGSEESTTTGSGEGDKNPTGTDSTSSTESPVPEVKKDPSALKVFLKKGMWMMITDKTNKSLYNTTAKADGEISMMGTPPFKMRVGRADGVTVEYMGQKTDFAALPTFSRKSKQATIGTTSNP